MFDSFFTTFRKSFTFRFFPSLLTWPVKRVVFYFLSLSGVLAFLALWIQLPALILGLTELTDWAVRKLPPLRFEEGHLESLSVKESYRYTLGKEFALVIDPQDKSDLSDYPAGILLKKDQMIFKSRAKSRVFPYPKDFSLTLSSFTFMHWRDILLWVLPVFLGVTIFLNLILAKGFEIVLLGSLGFFGTRLLKKDLPWKSCFFVSVVALTAPLTFSFLMSIFGFFLSLSGIAYYILYLFFFLGGLRACIRPQSV